MKRVTRQSAKTQATEVVTDQADQAAESLSPPKTKASPKVKASPKAPKAKASPKTKAKAKEVEESDSSDNESAPAAKKVKKTADESPITAQEWEPLGPVTADDSKYLKIVTYNVNGLKAIIKKGQLQRYVEQENPDILCLQEIKSGPVLQLPGYESYYNPGSTSGYAGTAVFTKVKPLNVIINGYDAEGRGMTLEFEKFFLVNTYVPNSGMKLERLDYRTKVWDKEMLGHLKNLEKTKPVVWCGDLNVAHKEIDLARPQGNSRTPGFTPAERESFTNMLSQGLVDSYRARYPDKQQFTFWSYKFQARQKNIGWRLDYFVVSEAFLPQVVDLFVRDTVYGSDHVPLGLLLPIELKDN